MKKTIKYLQDGEYHYATVKDVGDLEQLKTKHKEDLVTALNELFTTGGSATPTGYDDLIKKVNDTQTSLNGINSKVDNVNDRTMQNRGTVNAPDFNSLTQAGYYTIMLPRNGKNIPTTSWGTLEVSGQVTDTNGRLNQTYVSDDNGTTYIRQYNAGTKLWTPWVKVANQNDVNSAISNVNTKIDQTANGINNTITDINGKVVANNEAIAQAKKDLQDALTQFQTFNDEIDQAKKDAETKLADAKQSLKDEFNTNLADAQKANQKQLEDRVAAIQGNLDTTSNTLNDVKTQLTNVKLNYGAVNVSIQKLNDTLSTKLSSTDLDPLKTSIQQQETEIQQTKNTLSSKAGKAEFDVLTGRVSTAESKIKQQADEISLGVKKSELNGAIDNYQIEGTNRLRNTLDFDIDGGYWKLDQYSINSNTDVHPYDQAHDISVLVLQKASSAKQDVDFTNEDLGQSFVISMWNKKDAQPQVWYGNTQLTNRQVAEIKGDYERSFFTFIPTNVNVKTLMFKYDAGTVDQLVIGEPKLELGTKPKAYAPNPNDEHKQIVNTKAELKIASDKIESAVEKQTKTDDNVNQLSSRITQTEQGITATNDLITKTKDGLIKDYTGKIDASAKSLSSTFEEKTNEKIGQITDSGENLILNSAFTNETDRKDKWQNISDKVNIVADGNNLMWAHMSQSGLTTDNPISLTSNYFPIKQGKVTVGVDIKSDNANGLSGAKILVLQTYNANKQRVDFTELSLENMGLMISQLADGQSHRGVYRLGNDRSDAVYMTVKAVLPRNGSIYFTNFSAKLSSIDNGGYTPNADDLKRQILNQKTQITQNSQQISLKASSTELRDVRTIANGAVSVANQANSSANTANTNAANAVSVANNANNNANQAKSNANSAVTTANSAKSTADSANTNANSALTNANSAVNTANTANTTANNANSKINDMQANGGGSNLVTGTGLEYAMGFGIPNTTWQDGYAYLKLPTTLTYSGIEVLPQAPHTFFCTLTKGTTYTQTIWFETDAKLINSSGIRFTWYTSAGHDEQPTTLINLGENKYKVYSTYTWSSKSDNSVRLFDTFYLDYAFDLSTGTYLKFGKLMLEKGTVSHDWSLAPEDIQTQIDQARTDIQSTLTVANNGITAATNLKTTYDNYVQKNDANIKLLGDRITNEVSKITNNGGGRNLLTGTSGDWVTKTASGWMNVTTAKSNKTSVADYRTGDEFTYSAMVLNKSDSDVLLEMYRCDKDGNRIVGVPGCLANSDHVAPNTNAKRISCTITIDSNTWFIEHTLIAAGGTSTSKTVQIKGEMFEKGTIAHDWQPASEDTQTQIKAVSSKIDQTATSITATVNSAKQDLQGQIDNTNTKITQTADSITEQLKSYSKTGDMQNYVNTTVQKTADGINSEVSDVRTTINNVNTKVEQYKTGINQTATGMNLFAQVITGNTSIDVTKSNIGIDPSQIKIASNKIVIDGNTSINGNVIAANNIKSGGTIEGVGLTIKNGDHVTTLDDRGFIDYKNSNKTVISDGTFMSNRVSLSGELQTSEKTTVNGATQYQTVSVGNGQLTFALYPFDPTPDIQINTSSSSTSTNNTDLPDTITMTSDPGVAVAGKELEGVGGKISASYGLPNLQTGTNDMTGLEILGQNISLTARKVADTIDTSSIDKSIIDINNNAIKIGVLQNGGRGNTSNIFMDNCSVHLDTKWLTFNVDSMTVNGDAEFNNEYYTSFKPAGNQDALYVISQKNNNSTQNDYAQTTLRAGSKYGTYGDSGLTFYWNSVKAFGTFDLRDTHVLGNRNTHFSVETTFDTDGEANMCFTWTSRSDLWNNDKLPMLARADWWTSQWGSCGLGFANGRLFYFTNDGHTYKQLN